MIWLKRFKSSLPDILWFHLGSAAPDMHTSTATHVTSVPTVAPISVVLPAAEAKAGQAAAESQNIFCKSSRSSPSSFSFLFSVVPLNVAFLCYKQIPAQAPCHDLRIKSLFAYEKFGVIFKTPHSLLRKVHRSAGNGLACFTSAIGIRKAGRARALYISRETRGRVVRSYGRAIAKIVYVR